MRSLSKPFNFPVCTTSAEVAAVEATPEPPEQFNIRAKRSSRARASVARTVNSITH
ncbi:hypothetical protein [Adhaeretor mobilis]|uniref:hypothetical protein n=1 Tax=Adhaeretor mobilis TaxID=1930276 RepID=UPI001C54F2EA|nr:hypothetical protein [Adhaeretor mobilis]